MSEEVENTEEAAEETFDLVFDGPQPEGDLESFLAVEAKVPSESKAAKGFYRFGKDLAEAVEMFGDDVVFSNFRSASKVKLQALMRSRVAKGQDVGALLATWKPGVQMERIPVDPIVAAESKFDAMNADDQAAFIEKLLAKQKG